MKIEEELLIDAILGADVGDAKKECQIKIQTFEYSQTLSKRIKILVLKIIQLLLGEDNKLDFGVYLKEYSSIISSHLTKCYNNPMTIENLELFLYKINEYNAIFKFLYNEVFPNINYIYDFFLVLKKEEEIKTIYQKYISKFTCGSGVIKYDFNIKEFIECINDSKCINNSQSLSGNKCDYNKLSSYVFTFCLNKSSNPNEKKENNDIDDKKIEKIAKKKEEKTKKNKI